jgi:hypothetical protein
MAFFSVKSIALFGRFVLSDCAWACGSEVRLFEPVFVHRPERPVLLTMFAPSSTDNI